METYKKNDIQRYSDNGINLNRFNEIDFDSTYPGFEHLSNHNQLTATTTTVTTATTTLMTTTVSSAKERKSIQERFCEFGAESTVHGIKYVSNANFHFLRRLFWAVTLVLAFTWLSLTAVNSFVKYRGFPVHSVVGVKHDRELDFPAVTLCNYNIMRKSKIDEKVLFFVQALFGISAKNSGVSINWKDFEDIFSSPDILLTDAITTEIMTAAHTMEDMLINCTWRGVESCDFTDFKRIITDWGVCYTFNNNKSSVLKVKQPGSRYGLHLRLNVEQSEYVSTENNGAGFKIYLHPQGVRPLVRELGFSVSPGFETSVSVTKSKVHNLQSPYTECRPPEKSLQYSDVYTVSACLQECREKYVVDICKCRDFRYPGPESICDPQNFIECVYTAEDDFTENDLSMNCDCPVACDYEVYDPRLSHAYFPSDHVIQEENMLTNATEDSIRKNHVELRVFFKELSYHTVNQVESYPSASLQGDIGGSMGLLVGMSLISVVELIDFLLETFCVKVARRK